MCDLSKNFKLCSCDGDKLPLEKVGWILERKNETLPNRYLKGKVAKDFTSTHEQQLKILIEEQLNQKNCFDFDYSPMEDDLLKIKRKKEGPIRWYIYRFVKGLWQKDESTGLDGSRSKHQYYKNGTVTTP